MWINYPAILSQKATTIKKPTLTTVRLVMNAVCNGARDSISNGKFVCEKLTVQLIANIFVDWMSTRQNGNQCFCSHFVWFNYTPRFERIAFHWYTWYYYNDYDKLYDDFSVANQRVKYKRFCYTKRGEFFSTIRTVSFQSIQKFRHNLNAMMNNKIALPSLWRSGQRSNVESENIKFELEQKKDWEHSRKVERIGQKNKNSLGNLVGDLRAGVVGCLGERENGKEARWPDQVVAPATAQMLLRQHAATVSAVSGSNVRTKT